MPSPFPGMDPYLERPSIWPDCHAGLILGIRAVLNARLPQRYVATTEAHVWREDSEEVRVMLGGPDILTIDLKHPPAIGGSTATLNAPKIVRLSRPIGHKQRYVLVLDADRRRVVTVIEVLSPANKTYGDKGDAYRFKRSEYLHAGLNLVEIDMLRSGVRPDLGVPAPASDYYALVCRGNEFPNAGLWTFSVRDVLPTIPVPLDPGITDVSIELRPCLDRAYDEARFDKQIDYTKPPTPPLDESQAAWATGLLVASRAQAALGE
jgi:hypothetical protein